MGAAAAPAGAVLTSGDDAVPTVPTVPVVPANVVPSTEVPGVGAPGAEVVVPGVAPVGVSVDPDGPAVPVTVGPVVPLGVVDVPPVVPLGVVDVLPGVVEVLLPPGVVDVLLPAALVLDPEVVALDGVVPELLELVLEVFGLATLGCAPDVLRQLAELFEPLVPEPELFAVVAPPLDDEPLLIVDGQLVVDD